MADIHKIIIYKFGFRFDGILFCWKEKDLYRMPYLKNKRYYSKRKLRLQTNNGCYGYWICGTYKSLTNLKQLTTTINHQENIIVSDGLPF